MVTLRPFQADDAYQMDWIELDDFKGMLANDRYIFDFLRKPVCLKL